MRPLLTFWGRPYYLSPHLSADQAAEYGVLEYELSDALAGDCQPAARQLRAQIRLAITLGHLVTYGRLMDLFGATQICVSR